MTSESIHTEFQEVDPDIYKLTQVDEAFALEAAWKVLRVFDSDYYLDELHDQTVEYLRTGEEERPLGAFSVRVAQSSNPGLFEVLVMNKNGRGYEPNQKRLKEAVQTIEHDD